MIAKFDCINHFKPFGYYVLARPMEYETNNDDWILSNGLFLPKDHGQFDYSFWARIIDKGACCKMEDVEIGDIVRLPFVYTRERFWNEKGEMYIIIKESVCIAKKTN
jgi:hypothetical protein